MLRSKWIKKNPEYIQGALIALMAVLPSFLSGGIMNLGLALFFGLFIFAIISWSKGARSPMAFWPFVGASAFAVYLVLHTAFHSLTIYPSIKFGLPIVAGVTLFAMLASSKVTERHLRAFMTTLVAGGTLLALVGYALFANNLDNLGVRFGSTFFQHNMYAGFMLVPIIISLASALYSSSSARNLSLIAFVIMASSFVLTFSRGGFIALASGVAVLWLIHFLRERSAQSSLRVIALTLIFFSLSTVIAYTFMAVKDTQASVLQKSVAAPYEKESPADGESGVAARFKYYEYAWELFRERPVLGFGLGSYEQESRRVQDDIRYYSVDPHNLYLRLLAETGLVGFALFTVFLLGVVWLVVRGAWSSDTAVFSSRHSYTYIASISLAAGFAGMIIHNGVDADMRFAANIALFFTVAGLLTALYVSARHSRVMVVNDRGMKALSVTASLLTIIATVFIASETMFSEAEIAESQLDREGFHRFYELTAKTNPLHGPAHLKAARVSFAEGKYNKTSLYLDRAEVSMPRDQSVVLMRGEVARAEERFADAAEWYYLARALAPYRDLQASHRLVSVLDELGRREEALGVAITALERWPKEKMDSYLWANSEKPLVYLRRGLIENYINTRGVR